jgi:integrase
MSRATFNRVPYSVVEQAKQAKQAKQDSLPLAPFTVHDLRRTGSTLLNELGFNRDGIEKCLAGQSSRGVYNKAEYEAQRWPMMQEWADRRRVGRRKKTCPDFAAVGYASGRA